MTRIAFILLTHKDPEGVIAQARRLTATGDFVSIHFDASAPERYFERIHSALKDDPGVTFAKRRLKCGWGEWSLVAATLLAVEAAVEAFPEATHFYMLSGDCMPVKSGEYAHDFLARHDGDFIESFDFFDSDWIKTGIKEERLIYRHFFNERKYKWLFYTSLDLQRRFRLRRNIPSDLQIMIGSQWWCLRRQTILNLLNFCRERRDMMRFFATTWIPDETFFQTLVAHLVPKTEIHRRTLTFLMFTDYGMPATFYNDHYDLLLRQDYLFARKISAEALELRERLGALWQANGQEFVISDEGPRLFRFLTGRGRVGRRFAPRFWESEGNLGRNQMVHLIVAKKWHIAKRLTARIRELTTIPALDYVFDEQEANLPWLGGVASSLTKRQRHRRALLRLLFDEYESRQMVLCIDPSALSLITDFVGDKAETRILFIDNVFDDDYLRGHMGRIGLTGATTPEDVVERLLPVVRADLDQEAERLRDMNFERFDVIADEQPLDQNAVAIERFLDVSPEIAQDLAGTEHLFAD
ncbi:DUF5928 domain-containing protein [Paracoccus methylarcula]|uniref:Peptide O-xylosyltransferase n=1 Tax=Paracoccus methylarcula TaxID=72022 RepID=A0A422QS85_9RHOB|nr:DUF5928 domain-containing protein [Paracoccus methylarcula]RNF32816.1 glycosyl transferase [Paracoccus methylarcula]